MAARGRPRNAMTLRRSQVLACLTNDAVDGKRVTWAHIARTCGLHDYRDARRIAGDLDRIGAI